MGLLAERTKELPARPSGPLPLAPIVSTAAASTSQVSSTSPISNGGLLRAVFAGPIERAEAVVESVKTGSIEPLKRSFSKQFADYATKVDSAGNPVEPGKFGVPRAVQQLAFGALAGGAAGNPNLIAALKQAKDPKRVSDILTKAGVDADVIQQFSPALAGLKNEELITSILKEIAPQSLPRPATQAPLQRQAKQTAPTPPPAALAVPPSQRGIPETFLDTGPLLKHIGNDLKTLVPAVDAPELNLGRLAISDEGKQVITETLDAIRPKLEEAIGKPLSNAEAIALADASSKTFNRIVGRDQTLAWEVAMLKTRQELARLSETGTVDKQYLDTLMSVKTLGTDIARKLQSLSVDAAPAEAGYGRAIIEAVLKVSDDTDAILEAAKGVDFNDFAQTAEFYRRFIKPTTTEWIDLLRYNSMLSSPKTHIINAFSNLIHSTLTAPLEKATVGGIDFLRSTVAGTKRTRYAGEAGAYLRGYATALRDASQRFSGVLRGTRASTNLDIRDIPLATSGFGKYVDRALSVPMRLLEASDQFFTALTQAGETASLKYIQGKGVKVPLLEKTASDAAAYRLFRQDLFPEGQGTVLNAIDEFTSKVMSLRSNDNPIVSTVAKFTVPFVRTPMNIFKQGVEYSPLGFATMVKSADAQLQLAKAMVGSSIFAAAATLLTSQRLTWAEPLNLDQKNAFRDAGKQPYSVKIGDTWVSYQKLPPPVAFPMAMVALIDDAIQSRKLDESTAELILGSIAKYGSFLADQSYAKSIGDLLAAVKGGPNSIAQVITNYAQQLIPLRALGGWLARLTDHVQRQPETKADFIDKQVQYLMMNIPGLSSQVPARTNERGQAIPQPSPYFNAFSPIQVSAEDPKKAREYDASLQVQKLSQAVRAQNEDINDRAEQLWSDFQTLPEETWKERLKEMSKSEPDVAKKVIAIAKDEKLGLTYFERKLKNAPVDARAQYALQQRSSFETDAEWKEWLKDLAQKKILTSDVIVEIARQKNAK